MAIDAHCGSSGWRTRSQRDLTGDIAARGALAHGASDDDVVRFARVCAGARDGRGNCVAPQRLSLGIVEASPVGVSDRGARCGDDNSVTHSLGSFS